jgi:hypothetical protein
MSQQLRRVLIAFGLMAALFLASSMPSRAMGARTLLTGHELGETLWSWIQSLLPGSGMRRSHPKGGFEKEGSGINPNGAPSTSIVPTPTVSTTHYQGSGIDPDGGR